MIASAASIRMPTPSSASLRLLLVALSALPASAYHLRGSRELYAHDDDDDDGDLGPLFGLFLVVVTPLIIYWNERQHVKLIRHYRAARRVATPVDAAAPPDACDGALVCFSGMVEGGAALTDAVVPAVSVGDALLLMRSAEILQWEEYSTGGKKNKTWHVRSKWFDAPQPDCKHTRRTNPSGNWAVFSSEDLLATRHNRKGASIQFGDSQTVFRAPAPHVGGFDLPPALMDEMFVGPKHLHRLHQLELIQAAQGEWMDVPVHTLGEGCAATGADGKPIALAVARYGGRTYLRDGDGSDAAGTVRMSWRVAKPQLFTVLAEAVKPGRAYTGTYGSDGFTVSDPEAVVRHFTDELLGRDEVHAPLTRQASEPARKLAHPKDARWAVTPHHVFERFLCCETFLGRLWLFAPGELSTKELFAMAIKAENRCTCHVRVATMLLLYVGWLYLFSPLTETLRWIPFGDLVSYAVFFVAFVLASTCWASTTALVWLVVHPVEAALTLTTVWCLCAIFATHDESELSDLASFS